MILEYPPPSLPYAPPSSACHSDKPLPLRGGLPEQEVMCVFLPAGVCGLQLLHPLGGHAGAALPPLLQWLPHAVGGLGVRAAPGPPLGTVPRKVRTGGRWRGFTTPEEAAADPF